MTLLQKEIEEGVELSEEEIRKKYKKDWKKKDGRYFRSNITLFIVKNDWVITIWMKKMKRIPHAPRRRTRK